MDLLGLACLVSSLGMELLPVTAPLPASYAMGCLAHLLSASGLPHVSQVLKPLLDGEHAMLLQGSTELPPGSVPRSASVRGLGGLVTTLSNLFGVRGKPLTVDAFPTMSYLSKMAVGYLRSHELEVGPDSYWSSNGLTPVSLHQAEDPADVAAEALRVVEVLRGRCLYRSELLKCLREANTAPYGHLDSLLDLGANAGLCTVEPAISLVGVGVPVCGRCGATSAVTQSYCPSCKTDTCWLCTECQQMGEARSCLELYMAPAAEGIGEEAARADTPQRLSFRFDLTQPQADASEALRGFVTADGPRECLVWAVCGAGKTEVAFAAVHEALRLGQRVLFAIPRRDVVLELEPRLRETFGWVDIAVMYGGAEGIFRPGRLVLSTTHQVLRRYHTFDLAIVDEADAFPFIGNRMLIHGVHRAMVPGGRLIYMTATPDARLKAKAARGEMSVVAIPARHHRKPLPEPELRSSALPSPGEKSAPRALPSEVIHMVHQSVEAGGRQLFVFAPTVELVGLYGRLIRLALPNLVVDTCHSRDEERAKKRESFQQGSIQVLVSTSILERGITVTGCDVLVLNADYERIFEERALVQMAGRAGRSSSAPTGRVVLVGRSVNREMEKAVKHIRDMNQLAVDKGYLDA